MAITLGDAGAPSQLITNFDALFSQSLAAYRKTLEDNISESNAFFYELKNLGMWKTQDGGSDIRETLLYEISTMEPYDGYDELPDAPNDGVTQSVWEWRQGAIPISYSMKELKQNRQKLHDLVKTKIMQAEMGSIESFNKQFLQGSLAEAGGGTFLYTPYGNAINGSSFITPLGALIDFDPTASRVIGNINQNTSTWWRNRTKTSQATTYLELLQEFENLYNTCSRGPGGPPNLILVDQTTYELLNAAYYIRYRTTAPSDGNYPFENIKFRKAKIVWEPFMVDAYSGLANTNTYGTAYFINSKFMNVTVDSMTNFTQTEFAKPLKGDSRLAHILFMGQSTMNNRRKHGVLGKIARTLVEAD